MSNSDENIRAKHKEICEQLNIDSTTEEKSWNSFSDIRHKYALDGDAIHWLCCSLYVACKVTVTPTVASSDAVRFIQGNCVSLTRLLRICNIKLHDFFTKIQRWTEMASIPTEYRENIEHLRHSFAVSLSIYQKYGTIFDDLFCKPNPDDLKKGKKAKPIPCTPSRLFEFCWTLFICAKAEYPDQSIDLVTSYHMLLACLDLVFANALDDKRVDLINPDFRGLPENWLTTEAKSSKGNVAYCIMEDLCERHEGTVVDAMETKQYAWSDVIKKFFESKILRGNPKNFLGLISVANFDENLKSLNSLYDTYILSCGEFDERIALGSKFNEAHSLSRGRQDNTISDSITALNHATPLTGRDRLHNKESFLTPVSTAAKSVNKLRTTLKGYDGLPHASLIELLKQSPVDIMPKLMERLKIMRDKFCVMNPKANDRFELAEALYLRMLENIIRAELKRTARNVVKELCQQEMFNKALIVCCCEIVIYAYNSQQNFPWILTCFDLHAFDFYKIIELVVLNHNDHLTRDIIKHLNMIEEQALQSIAWDSASPIWEKLKEVEEIPNSQNVDIPMALGADMSGITPHKSNALNGQNRIEAQSTPHHSMSKLVNSVSPGEAAKKQLFKDDAVNSNKDQAVADNSTPQANQNQSVILSTAGFNSPLKSSPHNNSQNGNVNGNTVGRAGAGSLGLFFRKFYWLASIRIKDLCVNLQITQAELLSQIWTIFEHSITKKTELMKDRHLDQILMCAIYVFVRVKKMENRTFADIMKFYRNQPQSASHVYRSVLISRDATASSENDSPRSTPGSSQQSQAQPGDLAGSSTIHGTEERGDIIKFYNTVYVKLMQEFAFRFNRNATQEDLLLSPLPKNHNRNQLQSPRKIAGSLYVHALEKKIDTKESPHSITFQFNNGSPSKELETINHIISRGGLGKRNFVDNNCDLLSKIPRQMTRLKKLDKVIIDRQENCKKE